MSDYQRGVEQASAVYKEVIREYVAENEKLRELARDMLRWMPCMRPCSHCERYVYPEGCEFKIRGRMLGLPIV